MNIRHNKSAIIWNKIRDIDIWIWYAILLFNISMMFSIAIAQLSVGMITILWIVKYSKSSTPIKFKRTDLDIPYLAFVGARLLSILFSSYPSISIEALHKEIIFYLVFFVFTHTLDVNNQQRIFTLFRILFIGAVIAAFYGSAKYILGYAERASSTTGGYYTLGVFLLVVFSMGLVMGQLKSFIPQRVHWIIGCAICTIGILFTFNRIHWIALFIIVGIIAALWKPRILFILIIAVIALLIIPAIRERMYETLFIFSHMSERDIIWKAAIEMCMNHPILGFGPRTFETIFPSYHLLADKGVSSWHNDFIEIFMESGIIGLGTYLWLIIEVYKKGIKSYRATFPDSYERILIAAVLLGITGFLISGMAGAFVTGPLTALLFRELLAFVALVDAPKSARVLSG